MKSNSLKWGGIGQRGAALIDFCRRTDEAIYYEMTMSFLIALLRIIGHDAKIA